jgi:hypothetical protein
MEDELKVKWRVDESVRGNRSARREICPDATSLATNRGNNV